MGRGGLLGFGDEDGGVRRFLDFLLGERFFFWDFGTVTLEESISLSNMSISAVFTSLGTASRQERLANVPAMTSAIRTRSTMVPRRSRLLILKKPFLSFI